MVQTIIANNTATSNNQAGSRHSAVVATKYTRRADDSGWLGVRLEPSGSLVFICEYTKVIILNKVGGRTYFRISDGNGSYVGKEASLKDENALKFLADAPPVEPATVHLKYDGAPVLTRSDIRGDSNKQQWAIARFNGKTARVTLNSLWGQGYTPIPPGKHRIMAPDFSHANIPTSGYRAAHPGQIRCTDVWFPIELEGTVSNSSRYIHIGHLSEGCVTFYELLKWNDIYEYLISRRVKGEGGKYIGTLLVEK
nr:hypothetical protein [uncultured Pseudomonas sp.]